MYPADEKTFREKDSTSNKSPGILAFFKQFLDESSLHGVKYISLPNLHFIERGYWISAVLACIGFSIYLGAGVYSKFNASPVIISFQPQETSIARIPFPAITICNVNILKGSVMNDVLKNLQAELHLSNDIWTNTLKNASKHAEHLTHFCLGARSFRQHLNETLFFPNGTAKSIVDKLNMYLFRVMELVSENALEDSEDEMHEHSAEVHDFFQKASHTCEDMILKCMWSSKEENCSQFFSNINTRHGSCCVFNMVPKGMLRKTEKNDEEQDLSYEALKQWKKFENGKLIREPDYSEETKYPKYQMAGGKPYGLSVLINPELHVYSSCTTNDALGLKMVAHSPFSFPTILEYGMAIPPSSEVFVDIEPQVTIANEKVLENIKLKKRGCLLPSDKNAQLKSYKFYTAANCLSECIAEYTFKKCNCVRFFMPRNATQKLCGAQKRNCSEGVRSKIMRAGKTPCSRCWPSCTEIKYKVQMSHFPLRLNEKTYFMYNTSTEKNKIATNYSILHIYYGLDSLYSKERKVLYVASELLANVGGLLGLTLGFSIISVVEILYFLTLRAWFQFRSYRKQRKDSNFEEQQDEHQQGEGLKWKNKRVEVGMGLLPEIAGSKTMGTLFNRNKLNNLRNNLS